MLLAVTDKRHRMNKVEYFNKVVSVVADLTDIPQEEILSGCKTIEAVDARWLIIKLMKENGYTARQISSLLNCTKRSITHALLYFRNRLTATFSTLGNNYEVARKIMGDSKEITP